MWSLKIIWYSGHSGCAWISRCVDLAVLINLCWSSCVNQVVGICYDKVLRDQVINGYSWMKRPYVKRHSLKSTKIYDQAVCLMVVFILKIYLKPHQKKIQGSSKVIKLKIMWQGTKNFSVVKERKCESLSSIGRVANICKGVRLALDYIKENHTITFNPLKIIFCYKKTPKNVLKT